MEKMGTLLLVALLLQGAIAPGLGERTAEVKATAYTTRPVEIVNDKSKKTACDDRLDHKTKIQTVAVSQDLAELGLDCGNVLRIEGIDRDFVVNDRLPDKYRKRIDIFFGDDVAEAKAWGVRTVKITWQPQKGPVR